MKKIYIALVLILIIGVYINRSYAHIYKVIDAAHLISPDTIYSYAFGQNAEDKETVIYVAIGDSLTAGVGVDAYEKSFPYQVAKDISIQGKNVYLFDRAVPGYKTQDAKDKLLSTLIQDNPDIVTIFLGVNDIHGGVSKQEFAKNYEEILKEISLKTKAKIYTISIPNLGDKNLIAPPLSYYFSWKTNEFNKVIKELSVKYQASYIEIQSPVEYALDSFHPSEKGYAVWAKKIYDNINI